jgi:mRNA-degrading endonuclease RelE of RelBE toxin-antitoxin system
LPESVNSNLLIVCSMSCNITVSVSDDFAKEAKRLAKKYPSFKQDYKDFLLSIKNNPLQGDEITKNIRKIRMAIKAKGKGKSGGARVITFNILTDIENGQVVFLLLYDKEDASTVKVNVVKQLVRDMGFDLE